MREHEVAAKLTHRGRGLGKLEKRVGPVCQAIQDRLTATKKKIRLLEIGCGLGVALMELRHRFRDSVELTGTNKERSHGNRETMLAAASLCNVGNLADGQPIVLPTILYCDMASGLPFDDCSFEVVVSQMCIQYVDDKVLFLREAARVLTEDGIAMIHTPLIASDMPPPFDLLLEIWDQGTLLPFSTYLAGLKGQSEKRFGYHSCVHLSHKVEFGSDLELVYSIRLNKIFPSWDGVKSTYRRKY